MRKFVTNNKHNCVHGLLRHLFRREWITLCVTMFSATLIHYDEEKGKEREKGKEKKMIKRRKKRKK